MNFDDFMHRILNSGQPVGNRLSMAGAGDPGNRLAAASAMQGGLLSEPEQGGGLLPNGAPIPTMRPDGTFVGNGRGTDPRIPPRPGQNSDPMSNGPGNRVNRTPGLLDEQMLQYGPAALSNPQHVGMRQGGPQQPVSGQSSLRAPSGQSMSRGQSSGGGFGDFLGELFMPNTTRRNTTVQWLQTQGLDEGMARLLAGNKSMLQRYLFDRHKGLQPDLQLKTIYNDQGREQNVLMDMNSGQYQPIGGAKIDDPDAPTVKTFYDNQGREIKKQWNARAGRWEVVGGPKAPSGMSLRTNPDGTVEFVQGAGAGKKLTEMQGKDLGFYTRGMDADARLAELDTELTDWAQENVDKLPLGIGNYFREPKFRQAKQAADSFLTALLRKDTGAAITDQEFKIYGPMFLPVPGDDPATIQQKRRARHVALLALRSGLGTAESIAEANRIVLGLPETELPGNPGDQGEGRYLEDQYRGTGRPAGAIPPAAINHLQQNPHLAAQFDEKYGAGMADQVLGRGLNAESVR